MTSAGRINDAAIRVKPGSAKFLPAHGRARAPTISQWEIALQTFSPREIQSRVRAGASAETVANDTGWPLDKVLRYAEPLLAERAFIAEQALAVEVRRSSGGATLRQAAAAAVGVPPDSDAITWDAWRREDGKWVVAATYSEKNKSRTAEWTYDHSGRNIHPLDDNARSLMGVRSIADDRDAIADALDLVSDPEPEPVETRPRLVAVPDAEDAASDADDVDDADDADEPEEPESIAPVASEPEAEPEPAPRPRTAKKAAPTKTPAAKSRKGRAHVPSWDEILFGATRPDDQS